MKHNLYSILTLCLMVFNVNSQNIGINSTGANAHPSALLDVDTNPANNTGFLMPRLTTTQRIAIASPAAGLQVWDINLKV